MPPTPGQRFAVIDVGSNSVLLTVAEKTESGWQFLVDKANVTAFGAGAKQTGRLSEKSMVDTLDALKTFFAEAHALGVLQVDARATMAARIASNTDEFLARALAQKTPVKVLSGDDEARLGLEAVLDDPTFSGEPRISVIDPGGHSTELVTAERVDNQWTTLFRKSFPVGTLALRGDILRDEAPRPDAMLRAVADIDEAIGTEYLPDKAGVAVVLGASGTNLVSIREQYTTWNPDLVHGATLRFDEVSLLVARLSALDDAGRRAVVGLEPGREQTVHLGALVLERFMHMIHVLEVRVSVRGWRHALLVREFS